MQRIRLSNPLQFLDLEAIGDDSSSDEDVDEGKARLAHALFDGSYIFIRADFISTTTQEESQRLYRWDEYDALQEESVEALEAIAQNIRQRARRSAARSQLESQDGAATAPTPKDAGIWRVRVQVRTLLTLVVSLM